MEVVNTRETLGATIEGLDLAKPLSQEEFDAVLRTLGERGVVRFPRQQLSSRQLADFSELPGKLELTVAHASPAPGLREGGTLAYIA